MAHVFVCEKCGWVTMGTECREPGCGGPTKMEYLAVHHRCSLDTPVPVGAYSPRVSPGYRVRHAQLILTWERE